MGSRMIYLKNVSTLKFNADQCTGCGRCTEVCPHGVFTLEYKKVVLGDKDKCMECGACAKNCSFHAIEVNSGVGCANAVMRGLLSGGEPSCDCSGPTSSCC